MSPFYKPLPEVPGFGVEVTAEKIGVGLIGTVGVLTAAHAVGSVIRAKRKKDESTKDEETKPDSWGRRW